MSSSIYNEDCLVTMSRMPIGAVGMVLTSPPYNTSRDCGRYTLADAKTGYPSYRYDQHSDGMTDEEYEAWTVKLFLEFARVVNLGGCVLYNLSYGRNGASAMLRTVARVTGETPWRCFDILYWKKRNALPDNQSRNRLTRIVEPVFVFVREGEEKVFHANKRQTSLRASGQAMYSPIFNVFEAANNDGENKLNKAAFSTEFVSRLLDIYAQPEVVVYDPFCGTGTTAVACRQRGLDFVGSEISAAQCAFAERRLQGVLL